MGSKDQHLCHAYVAMCGWKNFKKIQHVLSPSSDYSDHISDLGSWKLALENTLKRWPLNSLTIWHLLDSNNCSEVALIANRPQSLQLRMSAEIWGQSDHQEYSRMICCWKTNGLEINLCDTFHIYPILLQSGLAATLMASPCAFLHIPRLVNTLTHTSEARTLSPPQSTGHSNWSPCLPACNEEMLPHPLIMGNMFHNYWPANYHMIQ